MKDFSGRNHDFLRQTIGDQFVNVGFVVLEAVD